MIRNFDKKDEPALKALFRKQGFDYEWPDFASPLFLSRVVLERQDKPVLAIGARLTAETYLFLDKDWGTPELRWSGFLALHEAARRDMWKRGLEDCYCWLPPQIEKPFGKRLMRVGWERNKWPSFTYKLNEPTTDYKELPCTLPALT